MLFKGFLEFVFTFAYANIFTLAFDQFKVSLLIKSIYFICLNGKENEAKQNTFCGKKSCLKEILPQKKYINNKINFINLKRAHNSDSFRVLS